MDYVPSTIVIPQSVFPGSDPGIVLTGYSTPILFQLLPDDDANSSIVVDTEVIGLSFVGAEVKNSSEPVLVALQSARMRQGEV